MDREPALDVRVFANVERSYNDARSNDEILRAFAAELRGEIWPGKRMPRVFYDPRALELGPKRACMHAKCVVIDETAAFLTSANFTEAAQERNVEVGLLSHNARVATALVRDFDAMVGTGQLRPA
jgi:phosphatidylserine/phosphatidylglycerophosphate/cardiolipin synthase-like enzyme